MNLVRSTLFNLLFYVLTGLACVACLPTLFLPRRYFMGVVKGFVYTTFFLEKYILGLRLEVRGADNLPESGAYILAAKHQSAYETFKLHLLFKDPAVILKRELLSIPLWGLYLKKSDPIAINRKDPKGASHSIQIGAQRVAAQGRPIVIFPQGTRVPVSQSAQDKPYKMGAAKIQEATDLPIVPLAMNSGYFWPKHKWCKKQGCVTFHFLPPIDAGKPRGEVMAALEEQIETESLSLLNEAREKEISRKPSITGWLVLGAMTAVLFGVYSYVWFEVARQTKEQYVTFLEEFTGGRDVYQPPKITGYPGKLHMHVPEEIVQTDTGSALIKDLHVYGWPVPSMPIEVESGEITIKYFRWAEPLVLDSLKASFTLEGTLVHLLDSEIKKDDFRGIVTGDIDTQARPAPVIDLKVSVERPLIFLNALANSRALDMQTAMLIGGALDAMKDENGQTSVPVYQRNMKLFVGLLPVMNFPEPLEYDPELDALLHPVP